MCFLFSRRTLGMRAALSAAVFLLVLGITALNAQQTAPKTAPCQPQGMTLLAQALAAVSSAATTPVIQDFLSSGTITYYWADMPVQGTVTVRGRGLYQFRIDANLPTGIRSWVVNNGVGTVKAVDGTTTSIPSYNNLNLGSLTFPFALLLNAQQDPSIGVSYVGSGITAAGATYKTIRIQKIYLSDADPNNTLSKLTMRDIFIDPTTGMVTRIQDKVHPKDKVNIDVTHELNFSDYRNVNGMLLPFSIGELLAGQTTWSMQLSQIALNVGLTDADFTL